MASEWDYRLDSAVETGDVELATEALDRGADPNYERSGKSVLWAAVTSSYREDKRDQLVKLLIDRGAKGINAYSDGGQRHGLMPLHFAIDVWNDPALVCMLIDKGANVDAPTGYQGNTPLHLAIFSASFQSRRPEAIEIVHLLLKNGADVNAANIYGLTALQAAFLTQIPEAAEMASTHTLAKQEIHIAVAQGDETALATQLDRCDVVDAEDVNGNTPLHWAAILGRESIAKLLLSKGATLDHRNRLGLTPAYVAAGTDQWDMVSMLLAKGADAKIRSIDGLTMLHMAAVKGQLTVAEDLMSKGAAVEDSVEGGSALRLAIEDKLPVAEWPHSWEACSLPEMVEFLLSKGADPKSRISDGTTPLHAVIGKMARPKGDMFPEYVRTAQLLIEHGAPVNGGDAGGRTPLHHVCSRLFIGDGVRDAVSLLLAHGANPNVRDHEGSSPLAAQMEYLSYGDLEDSTDVERQSQLEVVRLLLEKGADPNAVLKDGQMPLHAAVKKVRKSIAELLIAKGADVNALDREGYTPLHAAVPWSWRSSVLIVDLLLSKGAKVNAKDRCGRTPLCLATMDAPLGKPERQLGWRLQDLQVRRKNRAVIRTLKEYGGRTYPISMLFRTLRKWLS